MWQSKGKWRDHMQNIIKNLQLNPPLVHNITNYVTVNDCANVVLAAGGSPLMADDISEVEDIVSISSSLYINVGTLNKRTIESMICAGKKANELGIPVVLDPVGMGASKLRNEAVKALIEEVKFSVIKGNISEIKALDVNCHNSGGVDALEADLVTGNTLESSMKFAEALAVKYSTTIAITGPIDIVTDGSKTKTVHNGHAMMSRITGTGCMTGSVIGTYIGANKDDIVEATTLAIVLMGLAGERAYEKVSANAEGTGSFRRYLIDGIGLISLIDLEAGAKIESYQ